MELEYTPFQFLQEITVGFSEERKVGQGSFGVVYRGVTRNGDDVAVKKLNNINLDYRQFQNEIYNLWKLKHQNIVQVFGYCYETERYPFINHDGSKVLVEETHRAICLEYLHNGSLQNHLSDELSGLDWHTRFKIIKGTCEGLKYIHKELEEPMYHLDLKPDNILLDMDMVPKISDFGLSRIFSKELTRTTQNPYGTCGYQPPEYIDRGEISEKFDIFSLGVVMIRIMSGPKGYSRCLDMSSEFIDQVQENWRNRLRVTCSSDSWLDAYCHQVETCTQIALNCVEKDSQKRPNIGKITKKLNEIETGIGKLPHEGCHKVGSRMTMNSKKIEMRKESHDITGQHRSINLMADPSCSDLEFVDARETSSDVVEERVVGRTEETKKIMALLEGMSEKIAILPIYGIGGIGKTTFARLIYNDPKFQDYSHVWIHVSQRFELNEIRWSIISQLSGIEIQANERQSFLTNLLSNKKILIVLDDLWEDNQFQLQKLKDMLYHDHSNIIILVTTRSECVAERICTNLQPYNILPLTTDMCWDIIKQRSNFEVRDDQEQLTGIGWEIAQKCCGVALAAQTLGFTLRSMNFDEWMKVKASNIWNNHVSKDVSLPYHVLASLKLSYSHMAPCLKKCFTYCAVFPKGHKIVKNDLMYQWISLDFIKPTKLFSNIQLCEKYIGELLGLSFFKHSESPQTIVAHHEDATVFIMHDLVHDLAELVIDDEILNGTKQDNTESVKTFTQYPTKIRALRILESDKTGLYMSFLVSGRIGHHSDVLWSANKHLRVLDLSECSIQKLPTSIGNLKQLRYLNAPMAQHGIVIPNCVTKLQKLIYLSLRGSSAILALPRSIGEMKGLMHLDLSGCSRIKKLPASFHKLKNLVHLDLSNCSSVTAVSKFWNSLTNLEYLNLSGCLRIGKLPEHVGSLLQLRNLNLSYSSYAEGCNIESFVALTKLERLNLASESYFVENVHKALSKLTNLKYLNLSGCRREKLIVEDAITFGNPNNLVYLDLSRCHAVCALPETLACLIKLQHLNLSKWSSFAPNGDLFLAQMSKAIGNLIELRYLNLSQHFSNAARVESISIILGCISNLSNLEHLDLSRNLRITSVPDSFGSLKKLRILDLSECLYLKSLPAFLTKMDSLRYLHLEGCYKLKILEQPGLSKSVVTLPHFVVQADCHDSCSNLVLLQDVNSTGLVISKLENVKSVQEARIIELKKKVRMKEMALNWTENAEMSMQDMEVLGELVPPITLEKLKIDGYNSVRFPEWFDCIASHLTNLVRISLSNLSMCNSLPPLGQLPNLKELSLQRMNSISKIDWDICGTTRPWFPRLQRFFLREMESLEVWYTTYSCDGDDVSKFMFPNLRVLQIHDCPNLRLKPCPHRAEEWYIGGSDGVLSSWGEAPVTTLRVKFCMVPMHQWRLLHNLPALTKLEIEGCCDLSCTRKIIRALSSLQSLTLKGCHDQPKWLDRLASLKNLTIQRYDVKSLQDSMGHLTRLQSLCLNYIKSMTALPQWVGDLISLQKLEISSCDNLNNLTESIGRLTSLHLLKISRCKNLNDFPESIGCLTSLNTLHIWHCNGITSLPKSMKQLIKLKNLRIICCKELRKWWETEENKMKLSHIKQKAAESGEFDQLSKLL